MEKKETTMTLRIDSTIKCILEKKLEEREQTFSDVIRSAIKEYINAEFESMEYLLSVFNVQIDGWILNDIDREVIDKIIEINGYNDLNFRVYIDFGEHGVVYRSNGDANQNIMFFDLLPIDLEIGWEKFLFRDSCKMYLQKFKKIRKD